MKIIWSRSADKDLEEACGFIALDNLKAAQNLALRIYKIAEHLKKFPLLGKEGKIEGTRELILSDMPFTIVYRIEDDVIGISRIINHSRNWH